MRTRILLLNTVGDEKGRAGERDLIIAKNKTGRTGKMRLVFNGNFQRFTELCERGNRNADRFDGGATERLGVGMGAAAT